MTERDEMELGGTSLSERGRTFVLRGISAVSVRSKVKRFSSAEAKIEGLAPHGCGITILRSRTLAIRLTTTPPVCYVLKGDTYVVVNSREYPNELENESAIARKVMEKMK